MAVPCAVSCGVSLHVDAEEVPQWKLSIKKHVLSSDGSAEVSGMRLLCASYGSNSCRRTWRKKGEETVVAGANELWK